MPSVQTRLPNGVFKALEERARQQGRTLEEQITVELTRGQKDAPLRDDATLRAERRNRVLDDIRKKAPPGRRPFRAPPPEELIREDRER